MKQETFTDIEYSYRKKKTKREEFLEIMEEIIPWDEWVGVIEPYYPKGKRGRPPMGIEKMLRMYLLQIWFNLSDPATEDAIYDSYAMRKFTGIDFMTETVPDETTLCKFRHLLETNGLNKLFFDAIAPIPDLPDRKTICIMERGNEKCQPKNENTQRRRVTMRPSRRGQCGWSPSRGGPAGRWPRNSASASTRCAAG